MTRHAIVTACDARFGDFLLGHWLVSLRANVDLAGVDVVVLDYGLTDAQRRELAAREVLVYPCVHDGVISNLRYRDICRLLDQRDYDQILSVDGGDVIFQANIRPLFDRHTDRFRAVPEQRRIPFHELVVPRSDLAPERFREILACLEDRPMVNAGVLFGPAWKFREFWQFYRRESHAFDCFGMDQLLLNYVLYRDGFVALDRGFNFVLVTAAPGWTVRNGVFEDAGGAVIPVVHNAGNVESMRAIREFGYGAARNRRRRLVPLRIRLLIARGWLSKLRPARRR